MLGDDFDETPYLGAFGYGGPENVGSYTNPEGAGLGEVASQDQQGEPWTPPQDDAKPLGAGKALAGISGLLGVFGSAMGAISALNEGQAKAAAYQRASTEAGLAAGDAVQRSVIQQTALRQAGSLMIGEQQAGEAEARVSTGSQSAVDNMLRTRLNSDINAKIVANNALKEAYGYRAKQSEELGQSAQAVQAGYMGAAASIIGGVGKMVGTFGPGAID